MRLLIIGTLEGHLTEASQIALKRGAKVQTVDAVDAGLDLLRQGKGADLCLIDVRLNIERLVKALNAERISVPVVACGIEGTEAEAAVKAIEAGAKEYIPLPPDPDMIAAVLEAVAEESSTVIHRDPATIKVLKLAEQIAPSDASVLITGESGTGKEVMARHLHARSKRASAAFVALNCAAIPENLLESELFGHEKGAFSGAVARRIGKFEEAHGGTLLLDEVSEMDPRLQAKLLRALQEREIDRVGGSKPVKVDVRILATSNRNLQKAVKDGDFREDLYFRLNVVNLRLPSLRERRQDIPVLARHFAKKYSESNGLPDRPLGAEAMRRLEAYDWPGNVRELENAMHRAVLLAGGEEIGEEAILLTEDETLDAVMPESGGGTRAAAPDEHDGIEDEAGPAGEKLVGKTVAEVERALIIDTLDHCLGNRTHAANILGISIRTLRNKLKQYTEEGFSVPLPRESEHRSA
ncbi:sigma-54-dependent Fis family transcriptional regulator [Marivibrio halodurans]|uniref:Sigma-54-dependent Fis family transcriptional regulator n=1 Tax=Marivibrio halodurans TaxID=2039722 RepID=A0A8J7V1A1_9PROT|nr:sigma-54 dependent transcriptional regulator [Marivibrio halodurans]MBP5856110.1 sigma-54-dependent Fis family transcriptional regulator [Marivibrio halodurans]